MFWLWWFFVLRHTATVFVDESGLLIRRRRGDVRVAFNQLIGIRRVTGARSEMYWVKYRGENSEARDFVLIPAGRSGWNEFPHPVVKGLVEKIDPERRAEAEGELNRSYLAPFG
jgi:hypothetical protein